MPIKVGGIEAINNEEFSRRRPNQAVTELALCLDNGGNSSWWLDRSLLLGAGNNKMKFGQDQGGE